MTEIVLDLHGFERRMTLEAQPERVEIMMARRIPTSVLADGGAGAVPARPPVYRLTFKATGDSRHGLPVYRCAGCALCGERSVARPSTPLPTHCICGPLLRDWIEQDYGNRIACRSCGASWSARAGALPPSDTALCPLCGLGRAVVSVRRASHGLVECPDCGCTFHFRVDDDQRVHTAGGCSWCARASESLHAMVDASPAPVLPPSDTGFEGAVPLPAVDCDALTLLLPVPDEQFADQNCKMNALLMGRTS